MLIGYARTSTLDQVAGYEAQIRDLKALGCEKVYAEQISSVAAERPELKAALDYAREGDTFIVTKLDRLARSVAELMRITEGLTAKGVKVRILDLGIDTSTPVGELMLTMLGGIAQFERKIMLERQLEGIAAAKRAGKYKGRAPTAERQLPDMLRLKAQGMGASEIARALKVGRASVYRLLAIAGAQEPLSEAD